MRVVADRHAPRAAGRRQKEHRVVGPRLPGAERDRRGHRERRVGRVDPKAPCLRAARHGDVGRNDPCVGRDAARRREGEGPFGR